MKATLGAAIKRERSTLRISQEELAHRAGLHRTYVSDLERGRRNPSVESIEKLAHALQIPFSKLFEPWDEAVISPKRAVEIILIEDSPNNVELALRAFQKAQITNPVHVLRDGQEALDFLFPTTSTHQPTSGTPRIILLDLDLPKVSGMDILTRLKAESRTRDIPVIVLTASDHDRDIAACRRLGCEDYIVKPVGFQNFSQITPHFKLAWTLVTNGSDDDAVTTRA